jgi:CHAD domain-containing protein
MGRLSIQPGASFRPSIVSLALFFIDEMEKQLLSRKGQHESIHQVRVNIKKMRALLRLIRPSLGEESYTFENNFFRDTARSLAFLRDYTTCSDALEKLVKNRRSKQIHDGFAKLIRAVSIRRKSALKEVNFPDLSTRILQELQTARQRVSQWNLTMDASEMIYSGLLNLYSQGRRRFWLAKAQTNEVTMHQLRKTSKYLLYLNQMLQELWPSVLAIHVEEYKELSALLGMHHDICVLNHHLADLAGTNMKKPVRVSLQKAMWKRKKQLENKILVRAARIYSERPASFAGKYKIWWSLSSGF